MVADPTTGRQRADADVIVVGAGPAGSTAATYLARAGLDVLLLEKSTFPRPKVCGDGFTPRGIKQIIDLGIDCSEEAGWLHNRGLRVLGGGVSLELDWPTLASFPDFGAVRPRQDFDELLVRHAEKSGARLHEETTVTEPTAAEIPTPGGIIGTVDGEPVYELVYVDTPVDLPDGGVLHFTRTCGVCIGGSLYGAHQTTFFNMGPAYFGPNFEFQSVPEPDSLTLVSTAAVLVGLCRRRLGRT